MEIETNTKDEKTGEIVLKKTAYNPGDRWLHYGPCRFIPQVSIKVIETREIKLLDKNEGIYVQDTRTGVVRTLIGQSYLL